MRAFTFLALAAVAYAQSDAGTPSSLEAPVYTDPPSSTVEIPVFITTIIRRSSSIETPASSTPAIPSLPSDSSTRIIAVYTSVSSIATSPVESTANPPNPGPTYEAPTSQSSAPPTLVYSTMYSTVRPASVSSSLAIVASPVAPYPIPGTSAPALPTGTGAAAASNTLTPFGANPNAAGALQISFGGMVAIAGLAVYFL